MGRDRERLLFTQLFANPSDRPTRGPVDLSPSDFHKRWNLIVGRLWCLSLVSGATIFHFPDKAGGKVVATWWLPQLPYTKSGGLEEHTPILKTTGDQISAKEKLQWMNEWIDRIIFLIYPHS